MNPRKLKRLLNTRLAGVESSLGITSAVYVDPANVRYVDKNGNDSTANGSAEKPYLTVVAAQASISGESNTNQFYIVMGPGVFSESNSWVPRANINYIGFGNVGAGQLTSGSYGTVLQRADQSALPLTMSNGVGVPNRLSFMHLKLGSPLTITKAVGDNTGAGVTVSLKYVTLEGSSSITSSGTGTGNVSKYIWVEMTNVEMGLTPASNSLTLGGCNGVIQNSRIQKMIFSSATVDGFISNQVFQQVIDLVASQLTLDATTGGSASISTFGGAIQGTIFFKGTGAIVGTRDMFLGSQSSQTGNLTAGSNIITGTSVPSSVDFGNPTVTSGIPIVGRGIPANTVTGTSPGANQIAMVDSAGNPVNATETITGGRFYVQPQLNFSAGAQRSQLGGGGLNRMVYVATTAADWQVVPATPLQAFDYLAARRMEAIADIASPSTATTEEVANKVNALLAALRAAFLLKP